jgi:hypothetical protein
MDAVVRVGNPGVDLEGALALPLPVKRVNRCLGFGFVDVPRAKGDAFGLRREITSCGHKSQAKGAISGVVTVYAIQGILSPVNLWFSKTER